MKERQGKRKRKLFLVIMSAGLLVWFLGAIVRTFMAVVMHQTIVPQQGVLEDRAPAEAIIVRHETAILAPAAGRMERTFLEGERVRSGEIIGRIKAEGLTGDGVQPIYQLQAERAGVVCYHPDGLENMLTPQLLMELELDKINLLVNNSPGPVWKTARAGMPVARIVDNLRPVYILVAFPRSLVSSHLTPEGAILFRVDQSTTLQEAILQRVETLGEKMYLLLRVQPTDHSFFFHERRLPLTLIWARYKGYILPEKAIVNRNGPGVYVLHNDRPTWVGIKLLGKVAGQVAVEGPIENQEVLLFPPSTK